MSKLQNDKYQLESKILKLKHLLVLEEKKGKGISEVISDKEKEVSEIEDQKTKLEINLKDFIIPELLQTLIQRLEEVQNSINSLQTGILEETLGYKNPPEKIKIVIEAISILLLNEKVPWENIRSNLNKNFKSKIIKFNIAQSSSEIIDLLIVNYFQKKLINLSELENASKTIVPLGNWIDIQLKLGNFYNQNKELKFLIEQFLSLNKLKATQNMLIEEISQNNKFLNKNIKTIEELNLTIADLESQYEQYKNISPMKGKMKSSKTLTFDNKLPFLEIDESFNNKKKYCTINEYYQSNNSEEKLENPLNNERMLVLETNNINEPMSNNISTLEINKHALLSQFYTDKSDKGLELQKHYIVLQVFKHPTPDSINYSSDLLSNISTTKSNNDDKYINKIIEIIKKMRKEKTETKYIPS